jgi:hypothetical protein
LLVLVQEVLLVRIMTRMMILDNTSRSSQTVGRGWPHPSSFEIFVPLSVCRRNAP